MSHDDLVVVPTRPCSFEEEEEQSILERRRQDEPMFWKNNGSSELKNPRKTDRLQVLYLLLD
jgi:hypothetical protein